MLGKVLRSYRKRNRQKWIIKGLEGKLPSSGEQSSIFHFSMNKAATQFIKRIFRENAGYNQMRVIDYHGYFFSEGRKSYLDRMQESEFNEYQHLFVPKGYIYTSFGGPMPYLRDQHKYRKLVIIRDPRDILVSTYFSQAYSHALPEEQHARQSMLKLREKVAGTDINDFVLEQSASLLETCDKYMSYMSNHETSFFWKYEDMMCRFEDFLNELETSLSFRLMPNHKKEYLSEVSSGVDKEDVNKHRRRATPGDHLNKLKKDTKARLDDIFKDFLLHFKYE